MNLRIQDLDFTNSSSMFNHDKFSDKCEHCKFCENCKECKHHIDNHENCEDYRIFEGIKDSGDCKHYCYRVVGEYKTGFILERSGLFRDHGEHQKPEELDSVFLTVSIFVNGEPQELDIGSDIFNHPWIAVNSPETHEKNFTIDQSWSLQTTVAYKILVREKCWNESDFPIPQNSLCEMHKMLRVSPLTRLPLSDDANMGFIMSRNLEHVLSVYSIPMPQPNRDVSKDEDSIAEAIALTCGDMSEHRIVRSAIL